MDISQTVLDFPETTAIRAIGVKGECKEVLVELRREKGKEEVLMEAVDLDNDGNVMSRFSTVYHGATEDAKAERERHERNIPFVLSEKDLGEEYCVLEPSAMMMKLAPWHEIARRFNARKFGPSSHLFITTDPPADFPGRVTKFKKILKKQDRKSLSGLPASVVSRNHPLSAEEIRNSLKLKEGDDNFIYATRIGHKPVMFLCNRI